MIPIINNILNVRQNNQSYETIKNILNLHPNEINNTNYKGWTPLMAACRCSNTRSDIQTVKLLIESKSDINSKNNYGCSALMFAVGHCGKNSNIDCIKLLIDSKADINQTDIDGWTPLIYACTFNNNPDAINMLLDYNADPNLQDNKSKTALMYLIENCHVSNLKNVLIRLIIKSHNSIRFIDNLGNTAYDIYFIKKLKILDDYELEILRGNISVSNVKSARKIISDNS